MKRTAAASLPILDKELHPGHFLIFCQKERMLKETPWRETEVDSVREKIALIEDILHTVETLDPGFTVRRGNLLKILGKERINLVKLLKAKDQGCLVASKEAKKATIELRTAVKCLKY